MQDKKRSVPETGWMDQNLMCQKKLLCAKTLVLTMSTGLRVAGTNKYMYLFRLYESYDCKTIQQGEIICFLKRGKKKLCAKEKSYVLEIVLGVCQIPSMTCQKIGEFLLYLLIPKAV